MRWAPIVRFHVGRACIIRYIEHTELDSRDAACIIASRTKATD